MRKIIYVGGKPIKADNVAGTGLTWARGEVHDVVDDKAADKLLEHKGVWADANSDYKMAEPEVVSTKPEPRVMIVPQGGEDVSPYWDPVTIVVPGEVFKSLQNKETIAVFMSHEDADAFEEFKAKPIDETIPVTEDGIVQPWQMDKRSRAYKDWKAANPDKAQKAA